MNTRQPPRPKPPEEICLRCGSGIAWISCNFCNGTGQFGSSMLIDPSRFRTPQSNVSKISCINCNGKGWTQELHICIPFETAFSKGSGISTQDQSFVRPTIGSVTQDRDNSSQSASQPSTSRGDDNGCVIIIVLLFLLVGVVFVPELRNLVQEFMLALWNLLLGLISWLTNLFRSSGI